VEIHKIIDLKYTCLLFIGGRDTVCHAIRVPEESKNNRAKNNATVFQNLVAIILLKKFWLSTYTFNQLDRGTEFQKLSTDPRMGL
jgi:hypothetical protein